MGNSYSEKDTIALARLTDALEEILVPTNFISLPAVRSYVTEVLDEVKPREILAELEEPTQNPPLSNVPLMNTQSGALDLSVCMPPCRCGKCVICGGPKHSGIHGPFLHQPPGSRPYGHEYVEKVK